MTNKCKKIEMKLSAYLDGELDEKQKLEIENHLKECPKCNRRLKEISEVSNFLQNNLVTEPEIEYGKIWEYVESKLDNRSSILKKIQAIIGRPSFWVPSIAVVTTLLLFCLFPYKFKDSPSIKVESVSCKSGTVMVIQTAKSKQPLIWILPNSNKENSS